MNPEIEETGSDAEADDGEVIADPPERASVRPEDIKSFERMSGIDDDIDDAPERNPLFAAIVEGDAAKVRSLLKEEVWMSKIDEVNENGRTPLLEASQEGHEEIVRMLLEWNADVDEADEDGLNAAICSSSGRP